MNMNHCCTRFFSNLWEINNAWLIGDTYISGNLVPFPGSNIIAALGTATNPFSTVNANTLHNKYGEIKINDLGVNGPLTIDSKENQMVTLNLSYDSTLHLTPQGQLSVVPHIITNADIDLRERPGNPVKIIYDDTEDAGAEVLLDYHEDDFKVEDGKLETIEPTWKGFGALKVGGISDTDFLDEFLEEDLDVPKLKAVRLQTTSDFSQTTGKLQIAPKGIGQIPYYTLSGLGADEGLYYNSVSNTLSTNRILLQTSFMLTPNDVPTKAYLSQYIQAAEVLSGLDLLEEIPGTNRRELKVRTNPFSMRVNATNQLEVNTGNTMKQDADGIDVKHDLSIKEDIAFGIGVNVDNVTIQVGPNGIMGNYQVMYPLQRAMNEISLQIDENSMQVGPLGLAAKLSKTGALQVEPGLGIGIKCDPLGPMFRDLAGLDLRLAPVSGLMKASKGLSVQVDPTGALSIDGSLGLDVRVDGVTITKTTAGLQGNYRGDVDGDITVTPAGIILCNISAGRGLQKIGTAISLLPEIEDKLDQVDDALDGVEEAKNTANNARTVADNASDLANTASKTASDLANKLGDLSSVVDTVGDLSKQVAISIGTSALTSATVTAISAAALGAIAKSQAQALVASKVGAATGIAAVFSGAFGAIGGAIAGAFGKKGNTVNHISNNTYNIGTIKEKDSDDEEDTYLYGFTLGCGTEYSIDLYPDRGLNPCTIMTLLGSGLLPVESTNSRTGMLTVVGGLGISGNIHAGKDIFANGLKVATESYVTGMNYLTSSSLTGYATQTYVTSRGYITSSALTPYLTSSSASSTYQPIITAGTGLTKSGNTLSVNAIQTQITTVGTLTDLTVTGQSTFNDKSKFYKLIENWQASRTPPQPNITAPCTVRISNTTYPNYGFESGTFSDMDTNAKILYGTATGFTQTPVYPTFYAGTITLTANVSKIVLTVTGTGSITLSIGYCLLRSGSFYGLTSMTTSVSYNAAGTYVVTLPFSKSIATLTGDTFVPCCSIVGSTTFTTWSAVVTFDKFQFSGLPTLNAMDIDANSISWYPDAKIINRLTSSATGFSSNVNISAPNLYSKSEIDTTLTGYYTKTTSDARYITSSALSPYLTSSLAASTYQPILTVGTGLTKSGNMISLDSSVLSPYLTSSSAASTYQPILTVGTGLTKSGNSISLNNDLVVQTISTGDTFNVKRTPWSEPTMTSNTSAPGYTASASTISSPTYDVWTLFDKAGGSWWSSVGKYTNGTPSAGAPTTVADGVTYTGEWVQLKCSIQVYLSSYSLAPINVSYVPTQFVLLGSNDGSTFSLLDAQTNAPWVGNATKTFNVTTTSKFQYFRIVWQATLSTATYIGMNTWSLVGYTGDVAVKSDVFTWNTKPVAVIDDITSALIPYITNSSLNTTLSTYVTNSSLNTTLGSYVTTSSLNTTLGSYVTSSSLSTKANVFIVSIPLTYDNNFITADVYSKGYLDTNFALKSYVDTQISTRQISGDFATNTALTNGLAAKANTFTVSTPLVFTGSNLSLDTSALYTKIEADNTFQKKLVIGQNLVSDGINISTSLDPVFNSVTTGSIVIRKVFTSPTSMTTTTLDGFNVNQSSRYSTIYSGYNMFSSSTVNGWRTGQYYTTPYSGFASTATTNSGTLIGDYVVITCPLPTVLTTFTITAHPSYLANMPNSFAMVGSNDGTTWVILGTFAENNITTKTYTLSGGAKYTMFRFVVMGINSGTYAVIQKMRLDGFTEEPWDVIAGTGLTKSGSTISFDTSVLSPYLTTATAASTYLTTSTAANTYQPIMNSNTNLTLNELLTSGKLTVGTTLWANTINSNVGRCTIPTQVYISNSGAVNYNWNSLASSTGGCLEVEGHSVFHAPVLISGKNKIANPNGGSFRWFSYDNTGLSSTQGTNPYAFILAQNTYMLGAQGSMIHMYSDARCKKDIDTIDGEKALDIVKEQRAVSFRYKDASDKRFGMIAQECIEQDYLRDLVSVAKMGDEEERYVMSSADVTFILWAAVRTLAAEVEKLKSKK